MADERNQFAVLMEQAIQGNRQAAVEVFEKYHKALIRVIRQHLKQFPQLRRLHDSDDFLQMALPAFEWVIFGLEGAETP